MAGVVQAGGDKELWHRAERALAAGRLPAARADFEALVASEPGHVMARLRLSTLATSQGRYRDSVAQLLAIAALGPNDPHLLAMLAGMLHRLGEVAAALGCLRQPALERSDDPALLREMAQLASQMEDMALARGLLDAAGRRATAHPSALYTRATLQLFEGELEQAEASFEACLALAPGHAQAHWALSRLRTQTAARNHVTRLQSLLRAGQEPASAALLEFALFKELDDLDRCQEAWPALMRGCGNKRRMLAYRAADEQSAFDALMSMPAGADAADDSDAAGGVADGADAPAPIFIIGLPRTGTTLLERILGRHPDVQDAGELDELPLQLRWLADRFSKTYLDAAVFKAAAAASPRELGERYLGHAAWRARGRPRFTDKLPLNFLHVGFIARALPQARILHMVRDPMDSCFSNLKELFAEAYPYSYRLDELADHYGRYRRLMGHWHAHFPGRVLDVSYEALVADPTRVGREVIAHCGLDWRDELVDIAGHDGAVTTASSVQVRQGIHTRSVGAWRRYASQLEPLRARLQADGWLP